MPCQEKSKASGRSFVSYFGAQDSLERSAVSEQALSVSFAQSADCNKGCLGTFNLEKPKTSRVTTKTRGIVSALGEIIAHNTGFEPLANRPIFGIV